MAYDYSKEFIYRHAEDVEMVRTCYNSRQRFTKAFDYPTDCSRERKVINNVMRSLAMYYPDEFADIRRKVRTKIDLAPDGKWVLTVYTTAPGEKVIGRPPGNNTGSTWIGAGFAPAVEYTFKAPVDEWEEWLKELVEMSLNTKAKRAKGHFIGTPPQEWLDDTFAGVIADYQWDAKMTDPNNFTLERV